MQILTHQSVINKQNQDAVDAIYQASGTVTFNGAANTFAALNFSVVKYARNVYIKNSSTIRFPITADALAGGSMNITITFNSADFDVVKPIGNENSGKPVCGSGIITSGRDNCAAVVPTAVTYNGNSITINGTFDSTIVTGNTNFNFSFCYQYITNS